MCLTNLSGVWWLLVLKGLIQSIQRSSMCCSECIIGQQWFSFFFLLFWGTGLNYVQWFCSGTSSFWMKLSNVLVWWLVPHRRGSVGRGTSTHTNISYQSTRKLCNMKYILFFQMVSAVEASSTQDFLYCGIWWCTLFNRFCDVENILANYMLSCKVVPYTMYFYENIL